MKSRRPSCVNPSPLIIDLLHLLAARPARLPSLVGGRPSDECRLHLSRNVGCFLAPSGGVVLDKCQVGTGAFPDHSDFAPSANSFATSVPSRWRRLPQQH